MNRTGLLTAGKDNSMTLKCISPRDIRTPLTYSHVVVATGSRQVYIAGQVAEDSRGALIGAASKSWPIPKNSGSW